MKRSIFLAHEAALFSPHFTNHKGLVWCDIDGEGKSAVLACNGNKPVGRRQLARPLANTHSGGGDRLACGVVNLARKLRGGRRLGTARSADGEPSEPPNTTRGKRLAANI